MDKKRLNEFPTDPGVYLMKDVHGKVLYVGKAKNIRRRIADYFSGRDTRPAIPILLSHLHHIDTIVTHLEVEAVILEHNLIKKHRPKYNVIFRDDKSFVSLRLTEGAWPKLEIVRTRILKKGRYFGPYPSAKAARHTLDYVRRLFPLRQCSDREFRSRVRPCILHDMHRCLAPCVRACSEKDYAKMVDKTVAFLKGKDKTVVRDLYREMQRLSDLLEFEKAAVHLKTIREIEKTLEKQKIDRISNLDADAIGLYREKSTVILSLLCCRQGRVMDAHHFFLGAVDLQRDDQVISSFLMQYYEGASHIPPLILIPEKLKFKDALLEWLCGMAKKRICLSHPQRGQRKALLDMAFFNAKAACAKHFDETSRLERNLLQLQERLHLKRYPRHIECIDNSSFGGKDPVSCIVSFCDGKKEKKGYRTYNVRGFDDYAAVKEVLQRRFKRGVKLPDLLIIDGGLAHLNVAMRVLENLNVVSVDVIAIAKEKGKHTRGMTKERIFLPGRKNPILLSPRSSLLFFLQVVRDEAHRFALQFQKKKRSKQFMK